MHQFFKICISIEKTIGTIYRQLSETVPCDRELQSIWLKMADEEDQHALDLSFAARLTADDGFLPKPHIMTKVERMHQFVNQALVKAKAGEFTAKTAVDLSLKLENEFLAIHIYAAVDFKDESMRRMFAAMVRGDEEHCQAIRNYHANHYRR